MATAEKPRSLSEPEGDCESTSQDIPCSPGEKSGLLLVGFFKLCKAIFSVAVGAGSLHLIHRNVGDLVMRVMNALPLDPEGRIVSVIMDKADLINAHDLRRIGLFAFLYAVTCLIEGIGLMLRKTWAEYFTVILTVLALPLEIFELIRRATGFKVAALIANLAILVYLVWVLRRRQRTLATAQG